MELAKRAAQIRILFLDVDGTLTDGRLYFLPQGIARAFHTLDGYGIRQLFKNNVQVAIITAADDDNVLKRAEHLGIKRAFANVGDKLAVVKQILQEDDISPQQAAYMGDDLPDLSSMQYVGLAAAPPNAVKEVIAAAHWVSSIPAGSGAVRELCDVILAAKK
ncbi:MAG: KdsC family phosphatase [Gammaproteobacteria bacterium WSBS_2016_MAG_OTU1]